MIELLLIQPLEPAAALDRLAAAYSETAVADYLTYETTRNDGTFDSVSGRLLIDPATGAIRYETAGFAFHAESDRLTGAAAEPASSRRVLIDDRAALAPAERLTTLVPTGPLPQLWSALDADPGDTEVSDPAIGVIRFTDARRREAVTVLIGTSAFGDVSVELDAESGRLIRIAAMLRDGTIELRASPTDPGDPSSWSIDTHDLRQVDRLDQLVPAQPAFRVGDVFPDLRMVGPDGTGRDLSAWQEAIDPNAVRAPWSLVILADATTRSADKALADASDTLDRLTAAALDRRVSASAAERFWLRFRPLVVLVVPEEAALGDQPRIEPAASADLLISTRPDRTIDRLPVASAIAVAIDRDRVIGAIGAAQTDEAVESFIDAMLRPTGNPPTDEGSAD